MKKLTAIFLILMSLTAVLAGCEADSWSGTMIVETSTSKSWSVSWGSMNGTQSQKLTLNGEETLEYSISGDTENISVIVKQDDYSEELSSENGELSLENFEDGKIKIVVAVTNAEESDLHFELK